MSAEDFFFRRSKISSSSVKSLYLLMMLRGERSTSEEIKRQKYPQPQEQDKSHNALQHEYRLGFESRSTHLFFFFLTGDSRSVADIAFLHLHLKSAAEKQQGHISLSVDC